ncbi:MAG: TIGR02757 family protein [Synergistaceae bacterium]|jgi:uncharacterized protein (TIGR02757 family)|nr:TIGR02757 family protein [Synergistaceae bacterium]
MYELLEELYAEYNKREYVSPDPLEFLYLYSDPADREVVGLIASSLAYGRVASILASVRRVLDVLGAHPADALVSMNENSLLDRLRGFKHRFNDAAEMAKFLSGIGRAVRENGSLENLFCANINLNPEMTLPVQNSEERPIIRAMNNFAESILKCARLESSQLLPFAMKGSACKRLALYIRWMVRADDVDPGGWRLISPRDIIIPLDTHMFRITRGLGMVTRRAADGRAALEATDGFRALRPDDPVRYDFALTRFGIRTGMSVDELLKKFNGV